MNVVELDRATVTIGGRDILVDTSFAIRRGEFVGVLGPNGAGKTTLMRAILGLLPPARGDIRVLGRPVARGNPLVGYMPQTRSAAIAARLSGWDFVAAAVRGNRWGLPRLDASRRREVGHAL